ncbi:MAG: hypothetical protein MUE30_09205 [Spirosomaceae bacterium]|jgi:hypothetical protein|nr:hypothetical protein [Spirosomataceae bacterium]
MKRLLYSLLLATLSLTQTVAQLRPYREDERKFFTDFGVGVGVFKAGNAYTVNPLLMTNTRLGWQMYFSPQYIVSRRLNVGAKIGGIFRPKFNDLESNSVVQPKFTPWGLAFMDFHLGQGGRRSALFVGLGAGVTHIGSMEAKRNDTKETFMLRRRDRDVFATIVPRLGIAFREIKIQGEYFVTTPFNPDFISLSITGTIPTGKKRYY